MVFSSSGPSAQTLSVPVTKLLEHPLEKESTAILLVNTKPARSKCEKQGQNSVSPTDWNIHTKSETCPLSPQTTKKRCLSHAKMTDENNSKASKNDNLGTGFHMNHRLGLARVRPFWLPRCLSKLSKSATSAARHHAIDK